MRRQHYRPPERQDYSRLAQAVHDKRTQQQQANRQAESVSADMRQRQEREADIPDAPPLQPGETARLLSGPYRRFIGRVTRVEGEQVTVVLFDAGEGEQVVSVSVSEVRRVRERMPV